MKKLWWLVLPLVVLVAALASNRMLAQPGFSNSSVSGVYPFNLSGVSSGLLTFQPQVPSPVLSQLLPMQTQTFPILTFIAGSSGPTGVPGEIVQDIPIPVGVSVPLTTYTAGFPALQPLSITGTFIADGAGNVTGGSGFLSSQEYVPQGAIGNNDAGVNPGGTYTVQDKSCNFTLTGTYSINADGSGTITLHPVGSCVPAQVSQGATFNILLGHKGDAGMMNMTFSNPPGAPPTTFSTFMSGSFIKQ